MSDLKLDLTPDLMPDATLQASKCGIPGRECASSRTTGAVGAFAQTRRHARALGAAALLALASAACAAPPGGDVPLPDMSVTARLKLEPGDVLLICTDGLWSGLEDADFANASRDERIPIEQVIRKLAERAVAANAPHSDNTSVAAVRWNGP